MTTERPADTAAYRRPPLAETPETRFWVEGATLGELRIQRCAECRRLRHPPRPMCPSCQSLEWDYAVATGRGTIYSHVTYHHRPLAGPEVPYAVLLVELEEGVRVVGDFVGDQGAAHIGMPVEAVFFADPGGGQILPHWRPVPATAP